MTDRTWDAVVIGAGPAGSVAARELARRGARVLLLDRATFPRPKVCGCCLNGAALAALKAIGLGHVPQQCGAVPLRSMKLSAGRRSADLPLPTGVAVSREAFDIALIREAEAAGVTFRDGTAAKVRDEQESQLTIHLTPVQPLSPSSLRERVNITSARVVILATGLAGAAGDTHVAPGSRLGGGVVVAAPLVPDFFAPGIIYMATGHSGYVGLVRLEDHRLDLAAAFDPTFVRSAGGLGPAAQAILEPTGWPAIPGLAERPWKGTPALTRRAASVAGHRRFVVGDAAGYVEPFTGEGMAWAIASAAALAPIAAAATVAWSDHLARDWQRTHARIVRRRQGACRVAARVLRSPTLTGFAVRFLTTLPILSRPVIAALNRPAVSSPGLPA